MLCVRNSTKKKIIHSKQDAIMPSPMAARLVIGQRATRLIRGPMIHPFCPRGRTNQQLAVRMMGQPKAPRVNSRASVGKSVTPNCTPRIRSDCWRI